MSVKIYNRKTKQFEIIKSKLIHIGSLKNNNVSNENLSYNDKLRISEFVEKVKYLGEEFGAKEIVSTSNKDIFKIYEDFKKEKGSNLNISEKKQFLNKNNKSSIDVIKHQLGL